MYMTTKSLGHSWKMSFMNAQNVASALVSLNGITKNLYEPYFMRQAVFSYPLLQFKFDNKDSPLNRTK
jgi:hypothetical protein